MQYMYFMFNGVASSVCFLLSHNLLMLLVAIPLHLFGYVMTLRGRPHLRDPVRTFHPLPAALARVLGGRQLRGLTRWWRARSSTS